MSSHAEALEGIFPAVEEAEAALRSIPAIRTWNPERFANDQLRNLVRKVFFPGWPRPLHQVVLTALAESAETTSIAINIGKAMASEIPGTIAVVESSPSTPALHISSGGSTPEQTGPDQRPALLRNSSRQLLTNLWLVPYQAFVADHPEGLAASWLRGRISQLRVEFDYLLFSAPPLAFSSHAALLGCLTDGVILIIAANSTRRITAKQGKLLLTHANARVIGTILDQRRFPIPERLYRKL